MMVQPGEDGLSAHDVRMQDEPKRLVVNKTQQLMEEYPRLPDERLSEYVMRISDMIDKPWRVVSVNGRWFVGNADKASTVYGPYVKEGNARNKARVLNAKHREEAR